jgi:hypothetical protein
VKTQLTWLCLEELFRILISNYMRLINDPIHVHFELD